MVPPFATVDPDTGNAAEPGGEPERRITRVSNREPTVAARLRWSFVKGGKHHESLVDLHPRRHLDAAPTLSGADEPSKPPKPSEGRVKAVRQMYAKLPCDILGFAEPSKRFVVAQQSGLGVELLLEDANGKELTIHLLRKPGKQTDSLLLATGLLPSRGPEESAVYGLLLRVSAQPPEKTTRTQLELVAAVLAVLDERFAGAMPIPPKGEEK